MNGFELILPFLRPIQHLILDPDISEIMVNGPERIFIEKAGYVQASSRSETHSRIPDRRGQEHCQAIGRRYFGCEANARFTAARWQPCCRRDSALQHSRRGPDHPKVQLPQIQDERPH